MIRIAAAARRALSRKHAPATRPRSHRDTGHQGWDEGTGPAAWEAITRKPVAGQPPWDWAGGVQPDPETAQLVNLAEAPYTRLAGRPGTAWPDAIWITEEEPCASGNGPVAVAEPLAPLPPEPKPGPHPAPATPTGTTEAGTRHGDALTLLDERQHLIDHAAAVIAAAKFDRILGAVMADA